MPDLVAIDSLHLSAYNPRHSDSARLDAIELSLSKLGFVFPIYATKAGEILSGHQRHMVATRMGLSEVPVEVVAKTMTLDKRKTVNVLFNRATNEMTASTSTKRLRADLAAADITELASALTDSVDLFPCMSVTDRATQELLDQAGHDRNEYGSSVSRVLKQLAGVRMPVLIDEDGHVLNGIGRLRYYHRAGFEQTPVVVIPSDRAQICALLVNKVSMDFDINERYADMLRYNSYRKGEWRLTLGNGFITELPRMASTKNFNIAGRRDRRRWVAEYGETIVDFGAGQQRETDLLRGAGIDVTPFEPYVNIVTEGVSRDATVKLNTAFLETIATGKQFSTIFISSVLNSVPFVADRDHIARILSALAYPGSRVIATARSTNSTSWKHALGAEYQNAQAASAAHFELDYEAGILLAGFSDGKPKVQKFHTAEEFQALFAPYFERVNVRRVGTNVVARCTRALSPDVEALNDSLRFEFDLPMPDGRGLGLHELAISSFAERLRRGANAA